MPKGWACIALASEAGVNIYGGTRPVICNVHFKFAVQMEWVEFHACGSSETGSRDATQLIEATPGTWLDNIFKLQPGAFCVGRARACLAELFLGHRMLAKGFDCFHTEASHPPLCTTGLPSKRPRDRRGLACRSLHVLGVVLAEQAGDSHPLHSDRGCAQQAGCGMQCGVVQRFVSAMCRQWHIAQVLSLLLLSACVDVMHAGPAGAI